MQFVCPTERAAGAKLRTEMWGEVAMFIIKVSWDAQSQQFRLMDQKLANLFEDGDMYLLVVDFLPQDAMEGQFIDLDQAEMGHA